MHLGCSIKAPTRMGLISLLTKDQIRNQIGAETVPPDTGTPCLELNERHPHRCTCCFLIVGMDRSGHRIEP